MLRIDYPKALTEQQRENETARHKIKQQQQQELLDEEVKNYYFYYTFQEKFTINVQN